MTQSTTASSTIVPHAGLIDVWSRTSPKYRIRAVLFLLVLLLLFAGLCCFTFWLRTGVILPWTSDRYVELMRRSFAPAGQEQITLSDFLSAPISVRAVPVHGVIMGLLFACLSSIPILAAILYRLPIAVLFGAMVVFLAAMPWLGITAILGCILASLPIFRFSFRYASALLGLIPITIYFFTASWEPSGSRFKSVQHQALMYAPWVLAVLSSCVMCAVALAIARLINYRPGGIAPVLAAVFLIPVVLFYTQVGRDELEYRVLEQAVGPSGSQYFVRANVGVEADRAATRIWSEAHTESYDRIHRRELRRQLAAAEVRAEDGRQQAVERCDSFIRRFPSSQHVASVLFLKGQALDQRIQRALLSERSLVEFRNDLPAPTSRQAWRTLIERFPNRPECAMADYKLAILEVRAGNFAAAADMLNRLVQRFDPASPSTQPSAPVSADRVSMFSRTPSSSALGLDLEAIRLQARRLKELIEACADDASLPAAEVWAVPPADPAQPVHPLQLLLSLDTSDEHYPGNLRGIEEHFPESQTAGYVLVRRLLLEPAVSQRIEQLTAAGGKLLGKPSGAEAMFQLAMVQEEDSLVDRARETLSELIRRYTESGYAAEAKDRLTTLTLREPMGE